MENKNLLLVISLFILSFDIKSRAESVVNISEGLLKGTIITSRNGRNFSAFIGVPYAEPPIGVLRFKSPEPVKKWSETYVANKEGNACPQPVKGKVDGKEDCLYLNVFTPKLQFNELMENETLLPVMFWIHGGGFHTGSSRLNLYGPNYLMDKDIILVTINYRLGILGFLSTGDDVAPGNFGMKDQVLALKWVQNNIQAFGGDPKRVTIFGDSAGGASVTHHAMSDKSNGLFHQYIAQSGNPLVPWGYRDKNDIKSDVNAIAQKLECPISDSTQIVNCLRDVDYYTLVNLTTYEVLDFAELLWVTTNEVESNDAFLTDKPENLIDQNKLRDYPLMTGSVADEGLYVTAPLYTNNTSTSVESALKKCINGTFNRIPSIKDLSKFEKIIIDYYFDSTISSTNKMLLDNFTKFAGDSQFMYPVAILSEKISKFGKKPVYLYMFGYRGESSYTNVDYGIDENVGVHHADDLFYLFSGEHSKSITDKDKYIIDLMVDLWTSFAINGIPTSGKLADSNMWKPYSTANNFLQIGNVLNNTEPSVTLQDDYYTDRMNLWKNNFPIIKL
ncbi:juvenile hormone esterase-like [Leptopilina boulardi]|uniref:juvenile hormone esterase-like n=1 Tax=Leptopilina boulardi TaxID=63433 RepID=UPI0021F68394|nr:juvenile hormone esterase-like [Leptopilina boulardi]